MMLASYGLSKRANEVTQLVLLGLPVKRIAYQLGISPTRCRITFAVAASNQFGIQNRTDVFFVNNSGALCVASIEGSGTWTAGIPISGPAPGSGLSAWAGEYVAQSAVVPGFPSNYFSPVVIHNNGSMEIASTPVLASFTSSPSPAVTFGPLPIKTTLASGSITFKLVNNQKTFAGSITPYPGASPTPITGTLQVTFPAPTLANLVQADGLLEAGSQCYIGTATDKCWPRGPGSRSQPRHPFRPWPSCSPSNPPKGAAFTSLPGPQANT
jgi:hypothetical protein